MTLITALSLSTGTTAQPSEAASARSSSASCPTLFHQSKHASYARQVYRRTRISKRAKKRLVEMRTCQHSHAARVNARRLARRHRKARKRRLAAPPTAGLPACTWVPESGGDYNAHNASGAHGKYQIMPEWYGPGRLCAHLSKSPGDQEACALLIYTKGGGAGNWVNC